MENQVSTESEELWLPINKSFSTLAIHAGYSPRDQAGYGAVVPSITMSTTFELNAPAESRGYEYSRILNPNRDILEKKLAAVEGAKHSICFASGLSALSAMISLLDNGDHFICSDDTYGGAYRLITESSLRNQISLDIVDLTNIKNLRFALKSNTKMVFFETPANPTLRVFDIKMIADVCHEHSKDILIAVDNSVLTSFFQRPLDFGADLVHYSLTKYMNGHADVISGAVVTNRDDIKQKLCYHQKTYGGIPSPFDCYLITRGIKTLHLRMPSLMINSIKIAKYLERHAKIESVKHPGLNSHPEHKIALKQTSGHSSLLSFTIKSTGSATKFLDHLKIISNAASYGGCESVAEMPAFLTHTELSSEERQKLGITDNFIRLSVGLENIEDLIEDIEQALEKC